MKLYYFPTSHWSRAVNMAIRELGLECEYEVVDITNNACFEPDYVSINPRGVVPTLVDDGEVVWDSLRIAKHLDAKHGQGRLWPRDDPATQAWIQRLHDFPLMLLSYSVWTRGERSQEILADKVTRARAYAKQHPQLSHEYLRKADFFEDFSRTLHDRDYMARQTQLSAATLAELGELVSGREWICAAHSQPCFADCIAASVLSRLVDLERLHDWYAEPGHPLRAYLDRPSYRWVFHDDPRIPEHLHLRTPSESN